MYVPNWVSCILILDLRAEHVIVVVHTHLTVAVDFSLQPYHIHVHIYNFELWNVMEMDSCLALVCS